MDRFPEVQHAIECSGKTLQHVNDVFWSAIKLVLHPQAPLMDAHTGRLQPLCIRALKRVFLLTDKDEVGYQHADVGTISHSSHYSLSDATRSA